MALEGNSLSPDPALTHDPAKSDMLAATPRPSPVWRSDDGELAPHVGLGP